VKASAFAALRRALLGVIVNGLFVAILDDLWRRRVDTQEELVDWFVYTDGKSSG